MPISQYTAKLSDRITIGGKFIHLHLELLSPNKITFTAGQYLLLNCPTTPQKRQYSIVSAPRLDHAIELLVEVIPNGQASGYLNNLALGAEVSFYAPAGEFTISPQVNQLQEPLVFVATGSGIAPFRAMILDQLRTQETTRPLHLLWGMRHADELFWLDQLEELHDNFKNFTYHIVLSQAPDEWTLCRGHVTDCLGVHDLLPDAQYYLCGSTKMITDVTQVLQTRGVTPDKVHFEKFI